MPTDTDYAWIAGFIDGDGCFSVTKSRTEGKTYPRLSITQREPELLHRVQSLIGGKVHGPYLVGSGSNPTRRTRYAFHMASKELAQVVLLIWPYLGNKKRQDYKRALDGVRTPRL